jgi:hypothetical protein
VKFDERRLVSEEMRIIRRTAGTAGTAGYTPFQHIKRIIISTNNRIYTVHKKLERAR